MAIKSIFCVTYILFSALFLGQAALADVSVEFKSYQDPVWSESTVKYPMLGSVIKAENWKKNFKFTDSIDFKLQSVDCSRFNKNVQTYLEQCENIIAENNDNLFINIFRGLNIQLDPSRYKNLQRVQFSFPRKIKLRGILLMRESDKPRPLVIFRAGLFSNTQEFFPERFILKYLFENSKSHILFLESTTSVEFAKRNNEIILGGYDEAFQNYAIAEKLKNDTNFSTKISKIHLFGISHAGPGILGAAMIDQINSKLFSSSVLFCPLIKLKETFEVHLKSWWRDPVQTLINWNRKSSLADMNSEFKGFFLIDSYFRYLNKNNVQFSFPEDFDFRIPKALAQKDNYWERQSFINEINSIQLPTLVWSTKKDPMVDVSLNYDWLKESQILKSGEFYLFSRGHHCTFHSVYNYFYLGQLIESWQSKF